MDEFFDFTIVILSLLPIGGEAAMVARLLRLLRVVRLISAIRSWTDRQHAHPLNPEYGKRHRVDERDLLRLRGRWLQPFHEHDPTHWETLGSALDLFRVVTLEDWTDVMYTAMEMHPLAWVYFVSFVVLGTFVVVNLFIAVVLNNWMKRSRSNSTRRLGCSRGPTTRTARNRQTLERPENNLMSMENNKK